MTTAFAHAVRGHIISAFAAQPAGLAVALATMAAAGGSLVVLATGRVWIPMAANRRPAHWTLLVLVLILGAWGFKIVSGLLNGMLPYR
jgi:hypothetical protein